MVFGCASATASISAFWQFATAPTSGQTLEVKDASGQSFDPVIQFTTDGKKKGFAINVTKNTGYTLWLGNEQLMDSKGTTVFTATEDKLVSFSGMTTLPADWPEYAKLANVGPTGTDVAFLHFYCHIREYFLFRAFNRSCLCIAVLNNVVV